MKFSILSAATATAISDAAADKIDLQTPSPQSRIWSSTDGDLLGSNANASLIDEAGGYTNYSAQSNSLTNLGTAVNNPTTDTISNTNSYNEYVAQSNDLTNLGSTIPTDTTASDAASYADLGVITVSGRSQRIKDAPATISVVHKEDIENKPIKDLGDIVQEVPGVATEVGKTGTTTIYMRGMPSKYTLIAVDGKRKNMSDGFDGNGFDVTTNWIPPTSMIDRVEVIRGPASTMYGTNAMGGVVNVITKDIPDHAVASVSLETRLQEDRDHWGNSGGINGYFAAPINEQIGFNLRGKYNRGGQNSFRQDEIDGWTVTSHNPYTSHSPTGYEQRSIGGRLSFKPNENNSFYLDQDYIYHRYGSLNTSSASYTAVREHHKYSTVLNHDGKYDFGNINSYIQYDDTIRYPHDTNETNERGTIAEKVGSKKGVVQHDKMVLNQQIQAQSTWNKDFKLSDTSHINVSAGPSYSFERLYNRSNGTDKAAYQAGLFAEAEYFINDYVSTTAGLRGTKVQTFGNFLTPRAYVNVYPTQNLTLKAGVAGGMTTPPLAARNGDGYLDTTAAGVEQYGNGKLDVERSWNYEIGAIYETEPVDLSATLFYTQYKYAIKTQSYDAGEELPNNYGICGNHDGTTCSIYANVDKAESKGVELSANFKPFLTNVIPGGLALDLNYAYTKTEQKSGDNEGAPLTTMPQHKASAKLSHRNNGWDTYLRWTGNMRTPTSTSHSANAGVGEYFKNAHIVDLGSSYKFQNGLVVSGVINNLFDQNFIDYATYETTSRGRKQLAYTNRYQRMMPGRNYWLNLRYDIE
ncbi:MAG: TonB-dependent receptor [Cardiobacteriaceae bacterium]|nr:TonB-dependent receptor [Cardiobacteriaceae bacterium]